MSLDYKKFECLYEVEEVFEWRKWREEIPYIDFHKDWLVRAIPAFHTGIIRYNIKHKKIPDSFVSIYLDCYDRAGCMDMKPYWEMYPHYDGDCYRCYLNETDDLIDKIKLSFKEQRKKDK